MKQKIISGSLILIPIITFFGMFFFYMVNAPINDDYQAVLDFLNKCISTDSSTEKATLLFSQHNEHRIVYDRIWTIISYKLQNNVNFTFLAFIGNLSLLAISLIFFRKFQNLKRSFLVFIPISVLLFNLANWENMTFAMAGMSNFTIFLFVILSLNYIAKDTLNTKKNIFIAVLFFYMALLTQGGGIFLLPISILILVYKKEYKSLLIYFLLTLPLLVAYFYDFQRPQQNADMITTIMNHNIKIVVFVFAFLGNAFNYFLIYSQNVEQSINVTAGIGFLLFVLFLYITKTKYYKTNIFNYSLMLFVIISAMVTAVSRVSFGLETAGASRYRINGIIFCISLYYWFIESNSKLNKKQILALSICTVVYYFGINLNQYEYLDVRKNQTLSGILYFNSGDKSHLNGEKSMVDLYGGIIEQSASMDTYHFPSDQDLEFTFPYSRVVENKMEEKGSHNLSANIEGINKIKDSYLIDGWAFLDNIATSDQEVYIGLKSNSQNEPKFYSAKQTQRFDLNPYFKKWNLKDGGFFCRIYADKLEKGEYKIIVLIKAKGEIKQMETDKKINI